MTLIQNARQWWKLWSIQLNAVGLALLAWLQFDPASVLMVWNMMPYEVRSLIPPRILLPLSMGFFALSMLSRIVSQPKIATAPENGVKGAADTTEKSHG